MIDLHAHVLPAIDDGPKTPEESIRMLTDAYKQGVRICVATPHVVLHREDAIRNFLEKRKKSADLLSRALGASPVPVPELLLGAEVFLDHDITSRTPLEALCIEGTSSLLVEFPLGAPYNPYWSEWLHSLIIRGFAPIVAHIDRYVHAEKMLADFVGLPITYQINATGFRSFWGRRLIRRILMEAVPCVVSSDMHNTSSRNCGLQIAHNKARKKFPKETAALFSDNAKHILNHIGGEEE